MNPLQSRLATLRHRMRSVALVRGLSLVVLVLLWDWPPGLRPAQKQFRVDPDGV